MHKVLTIGGSDPSGGAGIQADLKVFSAFKVYGMAVIAVLTAQNTEGVYGIMEIPPEFLERQLIPILSNSDPALNSEKVDAVKTGMLYSSEAIEVISRLFNNYKVKNIVVDPIIRSSTGTPLLKDEAIEIMKKCLFPLATLITPNLDEASLLSGIHITGIKKVKEAAKVLKNTGAHTVIIKGGHLEKEATDIIYDGKEFIEIGGEKIEGNFHGTGCAYSASITASLALGYSVGESALKAKDFVTKAIKNSYSFGKGLRTLGI